MRIAGWGRYPQMDARVLAPRDLDALRDLVVSAPHVIARGNGRAYGDSAINPDATIRMRHFDHMIAFDPATGQLVAEAGVLLGDIIAAFLPRGWFPMVSPGTKFVTLGGAIAADVHGKNHHKDGSFRTCVDWVEIMGPDGETHRCGPDDDPVLFDHTLGGMGLTGIILRAAIRLRPVESAWIRQTTIAAPNLRAAMAAFEEAQDATYSVAWIDCLGTGAQLGRSLVMLGEHATRADLPPDRAAAPLFRIGLPGLHRGHRGQAPPLAPSPARLCLSGHGRRRGLTQKPFPQRFPAKAAETVSTAFAGVVGQARSVR